MGWLVLSVLGGLLVLQLVVLVGLRARKPIPPKGATADVHPPASPGDSALGF